MEKNEQSGGSEHRRAGHSRTVEWNRPEGAGTIGTNAVEQTQLINPLEVKDRVYSLRKSAFWKAGCSAVYQQSQLSEI